MMMTWLFLLSSGIIIFFRSHYNNDSQEEWITHIPLTNAEQLALD